MWNYFRTLSVDQINFLLIIFAGVFAYIIPFEILLLSYAFLGPLHYLTEISWLHDRKYFSVNNWDPIILTVSSLLLLFLGAAVFPQAAELVWILLLLAFCAAFVKSWGYRFLIISIGLLILWPLLGSTSSYALAVMVPTVVHVFIFTLFFMTVGALRSKSKIGYINAILFVVGSLLLIILPPSGLVLWPDFVSQNYPFFAGIGDALSGILSLEADVTILKMAGFLAFTYTYHYLNWFSKTSIINWHRISVKRVFLIVMLYVISVGLYLYDYALGLIVLLSLSFLHVVLEFPLNFKSMKDLWFYTHSGFLKIFNK